MPFQQAIFSYPLPPPPLVQPRLVAGPQAALPVNPLLPVFPLAQAVYPLAPLPVPPPPAPALLLPPPAPAIFYVPSNINTPHQLPPSYAAAVTIRILFASRVAPAIDAVYTTSVSPMRLVADVIDYAKRHKIPLTTGFDIPMKLYLTPSSSNGVGLDSVSGMLVVPGDVVRTVDIGGGGESGAEKDLEEAFGDARGLGHRLFLVVGLKTEKGEDKEEGTVVTEEDEKGKEMAMESGEELNGDGAE